MESLSADVAGWMTSSEILRGFAVAMHTLYFIPPLDLGL
jgi:hypothetical protein